MIQFNNCKQDKHETLEDWADRVLSLANKAFRELPEAYMNRILLLFFCPPGSAGISPKLCIEYFPAGFSGVLQGFVHSHEIATVLLSVHINAAIVELGGQGWGGVLHVTIGT
jgi:hypothetical protein